MVSSGESIFIYVLLFAKGVSRLMLKGVSPSIRRARSPMEKDSGDNQLTNINYQTTSVIYQSGEIFWRAVLFEVEGRSQKRRYLNIWSWDLVPRSRHRAQTRTPLLLGISRRRSWRCIVHRIVERRLGRRASRSLLSLHHTTCNLAIIPRRIPIRVHRVFRTWWFGLGIIDNHEIQRILLSFSNAEFHACL